MTIFFTADTHFGHKNIIKYTNRPFDSVKEMDEALISNWNKQVGPEDIVYHLGDFTLRGFDAAKEYFSKLNGEIHVLALPWHHDHRWLLKAQFPTDALQSPLRSASGQSVTLLPPIHVLDFPEYGTGGYPMGITLSHYAMMIWDRRHYGAWHLFGHSHGNYIPPNCHRALDVGVDPMNFRLISLEEVAEVMMKIEYKHIMEKR